MPQVPGRTDIWREGKYLDLWSVVHFLSGASLALAMVLLHLPRPGVFIVALVLFIAYEIWEQVMNISETMTNHVADVVVDMASFAPAYLYLAPALRGGEYAVVFAAILIINLAMAAAGWRAWRKAAGASKDF